MGADTVRMWRMPAWCCAKHLGTIADFCEACDREEKAAKIAALETALAQARDEALEEVRQLSLRKQAEAREQGFRALAECHRRFGQDIRALKSAGGGA